MIADLKPYPEYKESGLPWLGKVPSTWNVVRNGSLFGQRNQTGHGELPILEVSLNTGVRVRDFQNSIRKQVMSDIGKYKRAAKGDVAYNMMRMWQGAVGVSPVDGLVSPAYVVARPYPEVEPRFFVSLFRTGAYMSEINNCSRGIVKDRNRLYWDDFKQILSPCPPPAEQAAIVRFLEWANGRLERTIQAKRKVIARLIEQKQAIIHSAVIRGLDPSVPRKPSGVPWLGDVPQHWGVSRSRRLFAVRRELSRESDVQLSATQAYGVIPQSEFEEKVGRRVVKISMHLEKRRHVEKDDFVISMRSFQGGLERAWASGAIRSSYVVLKPEPTVDIGFFAYLFKSYGYIRALQATADFIRDGQDLTYDNFRRVDLPLIPLEEQRAIADAIGKTTSGIDARVARLSSELDLLREYRTRLAADVVTGKLDVREVAAMLPEEALPEADALDDTDALDAVELADEQAAA
jgi:type I restriction enzyme, S subunit